MTVESKVFSYTSRKSPVEFTKVQVDETLKPYEILVDTHYVGLNPVDIKVKSLVPYVPGGAKVGLDFSGVVTKVGTAAASRFKPGDKVCGFKKIGPLNYSLVGSVSKIDTSCNGVMHLPSTLGGAESGGFSLVFATAWAMINKTKIDPNGTVLVLAGASSVGSLLIQLLKRQHKVKKIIATCSPRSSAEVKEYGADVVVDYRSSDYLEQLKKEAKKDKFLSIYDCAGGHDVIAISNDLLLPISSGSTYVSVVGDVGAHSNYSQSALLENIVGGARMGFRLLFGKTYNLNYKFAFTSYEDWPEVAPKIIEDNKIHLKVGKVFPAAEIQQAWKELDGVSGGKVILKF